jgi:hypothetical protein
MVGLLIFLKVALLHIIKFKKKKLEKRRLASMGCQIYLINYTTMVANLFGDHTMANRSTWWFCGGH